MNNRLLTNTRAQLQTGIQKDYVSILRKARKPQTHEHDDKRTPLTTYRP
jgi:preprotein translocase subunit Sss1